LPLALALPLSLPIALPFSLTLHLTLALFPILCPNGLLFLGSFTLSRALRVLGLRSRALLRLHTSRVGILRESLDTGQSESNGDQGRQSGCCEYSH
jgi:hypothetical protein